MKRLITVNFLLWTLAACSTTTQPTPILPSTLPSATRDQGDVLASPESPMQDWRGVPIMPEATEEQTVGQDNIYSFRVRRTPKEVQDFYRERLSGLGWIQPFDDPFDENGGTMTFRKEGSSLDITVMPENGSLVVTLIMTLA